MEGNPWETEQKKDFIQAILSQMDKKSLLELVAEIIIELRMREK